MKQWIEKHSTWIGIILITATLIGGTLLMAKKGTWAGSKPPEDKNSQEIQDLKNKINDLESKISTQNSAPAAASVSEATTSPSPTAATSPAPSGKININTASASQLDSLPGIGPTYSQRIVDYRNASGPFSSIEQIKNVKGIGDKTFEKFSAMITI